MTGKGRKAVEGGPGNKGDAPYNKAVDQQKADQAKGKKVLAGTDTKAAEEIEKAEADVEKAKTAGKSRGHSAWTPKPKRKRGRRGKGKRKSRAPKESRGVYKLGEVRDLHRKLTTPERHITFDHEKCNYQPPPGCGCSGEVMTQQSQPREELGETVSTLDSDNEDPVSQGNCPEMPADCSCRAGVREVTLLEMAEDKDSESLESSDDDNDGDSLGDSLGAMLGGWMNGIVCRVRTAMSVAQKKDSTLINKFETSKAFVDNKKDMQPLLACVKDSAKTDSQCSQYLPALMGAMDQVQPLVTDIQTKLGTDYQKAAKHCDGAKAVAAGTTD
jgi:hypothetical protein